MRKIMLSFFVLLSLLLGTMYAYQQWQEQGTNIDFSNVSALSQTSKIITLSAPSGKTLVPNGAILGMNDVNVIYYTYQINLDEEHSLNVMASNVTFNKNNTTFSDTDGMLMFEFDIEMIGDNFAEVSVRVSLNMPDSKEQYDRIIGSTATFQLVFNQESNL